MKIKNIWNHHPVLRCQVAVVPYYYSASSPQWKHWCCPVASVNSSSTSVLGTVLHGNPWWSSMVFLLFPVVLSLRFDGKNQPLDSWLYCNIQLLAFCTYVDFKKINVCTHASNVINRRRFQKHPKNPKSSKWRLLEQQNSEVFPPCGCVFFQCLVAKSFTRNVFLWFLLRYAALLICHLNALAEAFSRVLHHHIIQITSNISPYFTAIV